MKHGSLFSGIGGFDLAAQWMGWENVFHCEWNPFGQKVLKHYWPKAISYDDITKSDFTIHRGSIDILTGGFPCQPYSSAGKRLGKEDDRHLWPEMLRAIREIQPSWVVGENVRGLTNWNGGLVFDEVQADLENEGYEVTPFLLPACAVGAPHRRDRIWFVANSFDGGPQDRRAESNSVLSGSHRERNAYPDNVSETSECGFGGTTSNSENIGHERRRKSRNGRPGPSNGNSKTSTNAQGERLGETRTDFIRPEEWNTGNGNERFASNSESGRRRLCVSKDVRQSTREKYPFGDQDQIRAFQRGDWSRFPTQSPVCARNDGLPSELDGITVSKWRNESIKAAGNAIVPQVVFQIFKAIDQYEKTV